MSIYKTAIDKPVSTIMVFAAVIVIGLFALTKLPIDRFPEIEPPYATVMTVYAGASTSEVETNVTKLIENAVNSVDGLKELTSVSKDNISAVTLELEWGSNIDEQINDIRTYVDLVKDRLPSGCTTPYIIKLSSSAMPIIGFYVTADESYAGLEKILNDEVLPALNRVNGIGNISVSGAPDRFVYIDIDQARLDAYGLTLETVGTAIGNNNLNMSSGIVKMNQEQYNLQVRSEYAESYEIENIVVTTTAKGDKVYVRDIATVRDTIKDLCLDEKMNGLPAARLSITKQTGANTVQICEDILLEIEKIKKTLPVDIQIGLIYDSSEDITDAINSLKESILYALLFVVLVVFIFLGEWRSTIIIGLTIPISLIVAFIYLLLVDSSLNIISLCSLTIAIGMVVDDAIVVLENITKHIERGSQPREAAIYATNEVWTSVIATTLVIVAVFVPLTMLTGMAGVMFKELGWIVTIVVCTSTGIAISLTPMLCSKLLKAKKVEIDENGHIRDIQKKTFYQRTVVWALDKVDIAYGHALRWCVDHKLITMLIAVAIFAASFIPVIQGKIGTDFMQQTDNGRLTVTVELQRGTRIETTAETARKLEKRFFEIVPEIERISSTAGSNDESGLTALFSQTTNNKIQMTVVCNKKYQRQRTIFEIAEQLRQEMDTYPEIVRYQCGISSGMGSGESTVDVEIYGYDFNETYTFAMDVQHLIQDKVTGARDVRISRDEDRSELKIVADKEKLNYYGLNSATLSTYVRNRVNGMTVGYLKEDGDEYDIVVRLTEEDRNSITDIQDLSVPTAKGLIKLSDVAKVEEYWAPPTIDRKSRQRIVSVKITPYKVSMGELAAQTQAVMDQYLDTPTGMVVRLGGTYEDQQDTFGDMAILLLLIIMLVYLVMASQFESLIKPAIIMLAVPFAITGVILALFITGRTLDMIGALGVVMLVGIVVKNGIVLVDYINLMRDRGYPLKEAIALSGQSRLRPVLMTAFTTMLGMVPMAVSQGSGSEMWQPMGIVVIGGLLVSTLVTFFVVPVMYGALSRQGERDKQRRNREKFIFMQLSADDAPEASNETNTSK